MQERIKQVRKSHNLTQTEFGERLGVRGNTITTYETGVRAPSSAVITAICREFNISEQWLRTGEGSPHIPRTREEEIEDMVNKALSGSSDFKKAVIRMICTRTEAELEALEKMLWDIVAEVEKEKAERTPQTLHVIKIAGRDGSMEEHTLTDDEYKKFAAGMNGARKAPDNI